VNTNFTDLVTFLNSNVVHVDGSKNVTAAITFDDDVEIDGALNHDGTTVGFYGTVPAAQQTGVAVTAAAIHAALVTLGLITA
jgi:hypothetical protein